MAFIFHHYYEYLPVHYIDSLIYNQVAAEDILALREIFLDIPRMGQGHGGCQTEN